MKLSNLKITLLENTPFLKEDGTFDLKRAMTFSGHIGGICYNPEGLMATFEEDPEKTEKRVNSTALNEHQSVFEHVNIGMYIKDSSKLLNMVLNNEHQFSTSERSLRYTKVNPESCNLSEKELELYSKWYDILLAKIKEEYGDVLKPFKMRTLAQENARNMVSVFMNTEMVHTIPLVQLNRIVSYMKDFMNKENKDAFEERLAKDFDMFIKECDRLNLLDDRLQSNRKERKLEIFGKDLDKVPEEFGVNYSVNYKGTYIAYAQAERHRKGEYRLERNTENGYYIPPIIEDDPVLVEEWLHDINSVKENFPLGELLTINERGSFDDFIMKLKERDCSAAQLEIYRQSVDTKEKYYKALKEQNHPYAKKLEPYMHGRRCTYPDFNCPSPCGFKAGIDGSRKI